MNGTTETLLSFQEENNNTQELSQVQSGSTDDKLEEIRCAVAPLSKEQLIELIASAAIEHQDVHDQCLEAVKASPCSRRLMIRNIPFSTQDKTFVALFEKYGEIEDAVIVREKDNRSKGYGFITFKNLESVNNCLKQTHQLDGKTLFVKLAADTYTDSSQRKLFIRNLPETTTEEDLKEIFSKFGNLEECSVVKTKDGVSKGYGFLTFSTHREAFKAVQQQERVIGQRVVFIHFASPPSEKRKENYNRQQPIKVISPALMNIASYGYPRLGNPNFTLPPPQAGRMRMKPGINQTQRWRPNQMFPTYGTGNPLLSNNPNIYRDNLDSHPPGHPGIGIYGYSYPYNANLYQGIPQDYPLAHSNNIGHNHDYFNNGMGSRF